MEKTDADIVREIVDQARGFGIELLSQVELMEAQNSNNVNANLIAADLEHPLISIRNATISRIVLMVAREYAKPRKADRNLHRAFDLLSEGPARDVFGNRERALVDAEKHFRKCKDDNRLQKIKHFRDKFTAHIAEPGDVPIPLYKELFAFTRETIVCIDKIAVATGLNDLSIAASTSARNDAAAFWKPWADVVAAELK
ncbi:hypothetical protein QA633_23150 [Bradyrhizobium barranii]|uniref:hypothetical protein n=1 Tax=Bradyrhizobium barranii TaxID=2992140 RepID=UPI0024AF203D|nr:hypothetical protein [Bradyrhizobium barranii]WFT91272.1 hypothetical protein QA633_23150 [Bradyrhizobium barranii]